MSLYYTFPHIRHINDVLTCIDDNFRVIDKEGLTFINYNHISPDIFPPVVPGESHVAQVLARRAAIRRECRGITFDTKTGEIVSRPPHKFFNLNERPDTTIADLGPVAQHLILEKLDGSMVRPLPVSGGFRWGTKMGLSETALLAEEFAAGHRQYGHFAQQCAQMGITPYFEFCSRRARIVVDYPEESLVLLGARNTISGRYLPRSLMVSMAKHFGIPIVQAWGANTDSEALLTRVRNMDSGEGVVLQVGDGHAVKIKADAYVRLHKAKDHLRTELDLLDLVLNEKLDDILPVLSDREQDDIWAYLRRFDAEMSRIGQKIERHYRQARVFHEDRKSFALSATMEQPWKGRAFDLWNEKFPSGKEAILSSVRRLVSAGQYGEPGFKERSSLTSFANLKAEYGMNTGWEEIMHGDMAEAA